jgi:hypothetical protein
MLAFVILSPWNALNDVIGWDPRLAWSFILALRASFEGWKSKRFHFPSVATWSFWTFVLLSLVGLEFGTEHVLPAEIDSAKSLFLYFLSGAFASFAIIKLTHGHKRLRGLAIATASSILCASAVGLLQAATSYFTGDVAARIPGTLGNPNYFAAYLSIGATAVVLFCRLGVLNRAFGITACVVASITCLFTLSRMGTVACLLGVSFALLIRREGRLIDLRLLTALGVIGAISIGLAVGYFAEVRRSLTFSTNPNQAEVASMVQQAEDLSRLEAVQFAWRTWEENSVFGAGINTIAARNFNAEGMYVTTHDTYLQVLAGTGIAGFFLMATMVLSVMRSVPQSTRRFLLPLLAVLGLCSFFGDFLQSIDIFVLFAVLFALLQHRDRTARCNDDYASSRLGPAVISAKGF